MGKRGEAYSTGELWLLIGAFLLASFAGLDLLKDTSARINGTLLEKNYIARDLAMTIEAIEASPGDITYTYNLGTYRFYVDLSRGKISVKESFDEPQPVSYRIIGIHLTNKDYVSPSNTRGYSIFMPDYKTTALPDIACKKPIKIIISKKFAADGHADITISGQNIKICRDIDEACSHGVVGCE